MRYLLPLLFALVALATPDEPDRGNPYRWRCAPETINIVVEGTNKLLDPVLLGNRVAEMYAPWRLDVRVRTTLRVGNAPYQCQSPRGQTCIHVYAHMAIFTPWGYNFGRVPDIDEGNLYRERVCNHIIGGVYVGSIVKGYERAASEEGADLPELTRELLSDIVGRVTGHEIGHLLGLWHVHTGRPYYMAIGPVAIWGRDRWSPASQLLLDRVLGRRGVVWPR